MLERRSEETSARADEAPLRPSQDGGAEPGGRAQGRQERRLAALRRRIARIEGAPPAGLADGGADEGGRPGGRLVSLGVPPLDEALGGGIAAGLTELRLEETRDAGTGAGFALALAVLAGASAARPFLWIGEGQALADGGPAARQGIAGFGLDPAACILLRGRLLADALWAGEEAARSGALSLVLLEVRGNPRRLALEGTRRLHLRARESGTPLLLLRQAGAAETSAAPLRLRISPHASGPPAELAGARLGSRFLGAPAFRVVVEKSRLGRTPQFLLEWNLDEQRFLPRAADAHSGTVAADAHSGAVAAEAFERPAAAREARPPVALRRAS